MDDVLGQDIGGRGFGAKQERDGSRRPLSGLDFQVFVNGVQRVHLLALVFVQALDLDIENRLRVQG